MMPICLLLLAAVFPTLRLILMPSPGTSSSEGSPKQCVALGQLPRLLKTSKASRREVQREEIRLMKERRKAKERVSLKPLKLLLKRMRWTSSETIPRLTQLLPKL